MGCLRPFGTPNHIRQCSHSHPDLFIDLFVQCTVFVCFSPPLQCKEPSESVLCSSPPLSSEPQPSARDMDPVQCSSFSLMEFLAHPAVSLGGPTHHTAHPISHPAIIPVPASSVKPVSCPFGLWLVPRRWGEALGHQPHLPVGATVRSSLCWTSAPHPNPATNLCSEPQTHLAMALKLSWYQV